MDGPPVSLAGYLDRPITPADPGLLELVDGGPCDPGLALPVSEMERMTDPGPLEVETGWCRLDDGVGFVAARVEFPGVTPEMIDWWFDWHPRRPERYVAWHPTAHVGASAVFPEEAGAKKHWGAVHEVVEDVGLGEVKARIEFVAPSELGFAGNHLDDPDVGTIVCGFVGDRRARHSKMCHVWLREGNGLVLRSHFWLGSNVAPRLPESIGWLGRAIHGPLNSRLVRKLALPKDLPQALDRHCVEEYTNLAVILPPLYREFANEKGEK